MVLSKNESQVISFRTSCLNELKKISSIDNESISATVEKIITKHIEYYKKLEMRNHLCCSREEIMLLYDFINTGKNSDNVLKLKISQYLKELEFIYGKPTLKNICDDISNWLVHNGCELKEHSIENEIKFNVIHNMGKTWSKINSNMIHAIFKKFDYDIVVNHISVESFSYSISQKIK